MNSCNTSLINVIGLKSAFHNPILYVKSIKRSMQGAQPKRRCTISEFPKPYSINYQISQDIYRKISVFYKILISNKSGAIERMIAIVAFAECTKKLDSVKRPELEQYRIYMLRCLREIAESHDSLIFFAKANLSRLGIFEASSRSERASAAMFGLFISSVIVSFENLISFTGAVKNYYNTQSSLLSSNRNC